jgi:hypothetical protein
VKLKEPTKSKLWKTQQIKTVSRTGAACDQDLIAGIKEIRATDWDRREDQEKNAVTILIAEPIWGNKEILNKEPSNAATLSEKVNKSENPGTKI